jgi:predicted GNAT superfamily acetyltransferase
LPLCCEVNTVPKNEISLNFHAKNGFIEVGGHNYEDHSVLFLKK